MTSKERILAALYHEPLDRVPISTYELNGWNTESWENNDPSYQKLMQEIREKTDCIYMLNPDVIQPDCNIPETETWREGNKQFTRRVFHTSRGDLTSLSREDDDIHTVWTLEHFLKEPNDIDAYLGMPYEASKIDMTRFFEAKEKLGENGVMMMTFDDPICIGAELFEMGEFLVNAVLEPDKTAYFLDAIYERRLAELKQILAHDVKDVIFRISGPEYATPPYLPLSLFSRFVTKYLIDITQMIRQAGGIPRIHSHGRVRDALAEFAKTDAMAIDPLEPPPDGNIPLDEVKRLYGRQFCLFGNIELKDLEHAPADRVRKLVAQAMDAGKPGGGFVIMPTAAPINSPLSKQTQDNYFAYIDAALEYGKY